MTNDKAREYFSAYHEGALEPGLAASLERRMASDADLRAEYAAFADTVGSLDALRFETIEIPAALDARLAARLAPVLDARREPFWRSLLEPFIAGPRVGWAVGVAGLMLAASIALRDLDVRGTSRADLIPASGEAVRWDAEGGGLTLAFPGGASRHVVVTPEGGDARTMALAGGQRFELTLDNPNSGARRFAVDAGDGTAQFVALPGTRSAGRRSGSGTVRDLAAALADVYRLPVAVRRLAADAPVRWSFEGLDARLAAERSLAGKGGATLLDGNVLQLEP